MLGDLGGAPDGSRRAVSRGRPKVGPSEKSNDRLPATGQVRFRFTDNDLTCSATSNHSFTGARFTRRSAIPVRKATSSSVINV
jgi:hypothetical protein